MNTWGLPILAIPQAKKTRGPNNGHQLRDYSKSSNRSESPDLEVLRILSASLLDKTPIKELFTKEPEYDADVFQKTSCFNSLKESLKF